MVAARTLVTTAIPGVETVLICIPYRAFPPVSLLLKFAFSATGGNALIVLYSLAQVLWFWVAMFFEAAPARARFVSKTDARPLASLSSGGATRFVHGQIGHVQEGWHYEQRCGILIQTAL